MLGVRTPNELQDNRLYLRFCDDAVYYDFTRRFYDAFFRARKLAEELSNTIERISTREHFTNYVQSFLGSDRVAEDEDSEDDNGEDNGEDDDEEDEEHEERAPGSDVVTTATVSDEY